MKLLLAHGADPNGRLPHQDGTALHIAACNNRRDAIALLLQAGARIEAKNESGKTPLHYAVEFMADEAVPALLDAGADIEAGDNQGNTPLMLAASYGRTRVYYSPVDMTTDWSQEKAIEAENSTLMVKLLLQRGANVGTSNHWGMTALHIAAQLGHLESAQLLLKNGAVVDTKSKGGMTPFGGEMKAGITPLSAACYNGQFEVARLLLQYGANPDLGDAEEVTPRDIASQLFTPNMEGMRSGIHKKENQEFIEKLSAPVREGRKKIEALLRGITQVKTH